MRSAFRTVRLLDENGGGGGELVIVVVMVELVDNGDGYDGEDFDNNQRVVIIVFVNHDQLTTRALYFNGLSLSSGNTSSLYTGRHSR